MYTIKLDVNDTIYDKVMFFLKNIPVSNLEVKKVDEKTIQNKNDIVSFFQSSPLNDEVTLTRSNEIYAGKVIF